jgi:uncharacterized membrane protein
MRSRENIPLYNPIPPLLLIVLLSFVLRLFQLGAQSLWYDEAVSLFIAQQPIPDLIAHTAGDIHPPLYYLFLHFWLGLAGPSEFAAAFFSLFFGVLSVALVFRLARDWFGLNVGMLGAFVVCFSSFNLWYSQEVRMYTLVGCLALLALIALARLWDIGFQPVDSQFRIAAAIYVAAIALGLYAHYYVAFLWIFLYLCVTVLILFDWFSIRKVKSSSLISARSPLMIWHGLQLAIVVVFAPWLPTAWR